MVKRFTLGIVGAGEFAPNFVHLFSVHPSVSQVWVTDLVPERALAMQERFGVGIMVAVNPPDLETRILIAKAKSQQMSMGLSADIINYIATNLSDNIRQIEGALKKLRAHMLVYGQKCDLYTAKEVLSPFFAKATDAETAIEMPL